MANALYPKWKEQLLQFTANNDLDGQTVKAALVDTAVYAYSAADQFYSAAQAAVVGTPQAIANKTFVDGVFAGDDVTFVNTTGPTAEAVLIYIDTGTPATSPLVAYLDTGITGLPITPNGGDVLTAWNPSGIFAL
jgi:hypothetical protein